LRFFLFRIPILKRFLFSIHSARSAILSLIASRNAPFDAVREESLATRCGNPQGKPVEKWI
jgi:hypothetical protein